MFKSLASSFSLSIAKAGISSQVQAALICEFFRQALEELTTLRSVEALSFSRGVLLVKAPSPVYASELRPNLNSVCDYINKRLNRTLVERINIVIG